MVDPAPAIEAPGVRRMLRLRLRNALAFLVSGSALFSLFVVMADDAEDRAQALDRDGILVDGRVVDLNGGLRFVPSVDVEFTLDGVDRVAEVSLHDESPDYRVGQMVTVVVDPTDTQHVSIRGETNQSQWSVVIMIGGLLGGIFGIGGGVWSLFRIWRQRRVLARGSWRRVGLRYTTVPGTNRSKRSVLLLSERRSEYVLTLISAFPWMPRRSRLSTAKSADVVGELPGYVVVRAEGSEQFMSARPPATMGAGRRWMDAFDGDPTGTA